MNEILFRIYRIYFGAPSRAALTVAGLVATVSLSIVWSQERSELRYVDRLLELQHEIVRLEKKISDSIRVEVSSHVTFVEGDFGEKIEPSLESKVRRQLEFAKFAMNQGDTGYAKRLLEESIRDVPTRAAFYSLGVIAFQEKNYKASIDFWQRASDIPAPEGDKELTFYLLLAAQQMQDVDLQKRYAVRLGETLGNV